MTKKILLADDDSDLRFITQMTLSEAGYDVTTVANGKEAADKAAKENFDLILLDAMMPVMDGYDAYCEIRKNQALKEVPVVFLSARAADRETTAKLGGDVEHIPKPYSLDGLIKRVEQILDKK